MSELKNNFTESFKAEAQGDDLNAYAEKAWKGTKSSLDVTVATMKGEVIELEDKVDDAKEHFKRAKVAFGKRVKQETAANYIANIITAKNAVTVAVNELENKKSDLKFFQGLLKDLGKEIGGVNETKEIKETPKS